MRMLTTTLVFALLVVYAAAFEERAVRVEHSKPLPQSRGLGTQTYGPTETEKDLIKDWEPTELDSGNPKAEKLTGRAGERVAWFAIVREIKEDKDKKTTELLVEMKYFDGLTDLHQQIVSINGAGDFSVKIPGIDHKLKALTLVRVYGRVAADRDDVPEVSAEYVRAWDWKLFAFMPYGEDHSNPKWLKVRKIENELDVYTGNPTNAYYEKLLGKR